MIKVFVHDKASRQNKWDKLIIYNCTINVPSLFECILDSSSWIYWRDVFFSTESLDLTDLTFDLIVFSLLLFVPDEDHHEKYVIYTYLHSEICNGTINAAKPFKLSGL